MRPAVLLGRSHVSGTQQPPSIAPWRREDGGAAAGPVLTCAASIA